MVLSSKRFTTDLAAIWPFVRMCTFMYEEIIRLGEVSPAVFAYELLLGSGNKRGFSFSKL